MHYVIGDLMRDGGTQLEEKKREARIAILFVYWRIVLRLNRTEKTHIELREKFDDLVTVTNRFAS